MKSKYKIIFLIIVLSFFSILICSQNSPLYCFNNWVDENAFMTVGKSWLYKIIPYRDLFEQKGPLLYLIFLLANIISKKSFIGVFFLELVSMFLTLYVSYKIIKIYLDEKYCYYILPIFVAILTSFNCFANGGSAEEFTFPLFMYSLYVYLNFIKNEKVSAKQIFLSGLCGGCVFMIKFNLLGFWIGYGLTFLVYYIKNKEFKLLLKNSLLYILGIFLPFLLFSLYFIINNAFIDFINTYFLFNMNGYTNKLSFFERLLTIFILFAKKILKNPIVFLLTAIGGLSFIIKKDYIKYNYLKVTCIITYVLSFFGIYYGGFAYHYYFLFMVPYSILGLISIYNKIIINNKISNIVLFLLSMIIFAVLISTSNNIKYMKYKKSDLIQYKYAKIINKVDNPKILNYAFLDGGFYMASDVLPSTKNFELQNAEVKGALDELKEEIKNQKYDFIVVRLFEGFDPRGDLTGYYNQIRCDSHDYDEFPFEYCLFEKK